MSDVYNVNTWIQATVMGNAEVPYPIFSEENEADI